MPRDARVLVIAPNNKGPADKASERTEEIANGMRPPGAAPAGGLCRRCVPWAVV